MGVPPRAPFVNRVLNCRADRDVPASPGPDLPGTRWLRRPLSGAAVGAPLGAREWRGGTVPGSPSRAAGRAAVAPPGWGTGDTGRQLPLKAAARASGVRGRPILTARNLARRYWPGEPWWKQRRAVPGVKAERCLPNGGPQAALDRTSASAQSCALRVGRRPPRPCSGLLCRACLPGRASG